MSKEKYSVVESENAYYIADNEEDVLLNVAVVVNRLNNYERRLSNCIEPKFKIGQDVYMLDLTKVKITGYKIINFDNPETLYRIKDGELTFGNIPEDKFFATKTEARKKLEELKNG